MSQLNVDSIKDRTGADQPDIVGAAKAWVNFNAAAATIRKDFNVDSVTDNGVGDYSVIFSTAFPDGDYAWTGTASINPKGNNVRTILNAPVGTQPPSSTILRVVSARSDTSANIDSSYINVVIFDI